MLCLLIRLQFEITFSGSPQSFCIFLKGEEHFRILFQKEGERYPLIDKQDMKSILLLGGSRQQVVAIETAKRLGYRTVLCDYLSDNPGQFSADAFYQKSTTNRESILEIARLENVSGILAYSSDPAAPTAAFVAEKLGLPTNPLTSVQILSQKHLFRKHLAEHGFPCPKSVPIDADSTADELMKLAESLNGPLVLKPTDSSGSKGITILKDRSLSTFRAALSHAKKFSRNAVLILEEYIECSFPRVIGGDVFVSNGVVKFWGLMSCLRDNSIGGLVPVGERNPSGLNAIQEECCKETIQELVNSLNLKFGEFNVEIILGKDDVPYFLEFGARAGGNMIPVQLSDISDIDLVEANIRFAMGDDSVDIDFEGSKKAVSTYVLHGNKEGMFSHIQYEDKIISHVYREVLYSQPGDKVSIFDGANKALGIIFLQFDTTEQMENLLCNIGSLIRPIIL